MAFRTEITNKRIYDNIAGVDGPVHISWTSQDIGTGDDAGRSGQGITHAAVPGRLDGTDYVRTDITGFPASVQTILNAIWTDDVHTAYEAHLRA